MHPHSPPAEASPPDEETDASAAPEGANPYLRFGAMILVSTTVMYGVMYLNTYQWSHVEFSETRFFMALLMGSTMTVVMLSFMWAMYPDRRLNLGIYAMAVVMFVGSLWLVRSQATVDDRSYMRGMIPHHSIAVLTSSNADIDDVRVRTLADRIIAAQCREIAEMQWLIDDIDDHGEADSQAAAEERPVPDFSDRC